MATRKVFISYHHLGEQAVVDKFTETFGEDCNVFSDQSADRAAGSEDPEDLSQVCREAVHGTSVTIVMIGEQTGCRKFVDCEIRHTLDREHGLVGISKPGHANSRACLPGRLLCSRAPVPTSRAEALPGPRSSYPSRASLAVHW